MRRILTTTAGCRLLASSFSTNRRNPLLITFLIFMAMSIMKKTVWRHLTPYSCDQIVEVGAFQARHPSFALAGFGWQAPLLRNAT